MSVAVNWSRMLQRAFVTFVSFFFLVLLSGRDVVGQTRLTTRTQGTSWNALRGICIDACNQVLYAADMAATWSVSLSATPPVGATRADDASATWTKPIDLELDHITNTKLWVLDYSGGAVWSLNIATKKPTKYADPPTAGWITCHIAVSNNGQVSRSRQKKEERRSRTRQHALTTIARNPY
jgi:hypothetical protein